MQLSLGDTDRFLNIPEDTESTDRALLKVLANACLCF